MAGNDGPQSLRELLTTIVGTIRDTNLAVGELRSKVESSMARTEAREERVRDEIKVLFAKQRETGEIVTVTGAGAVVSAGRPAGSGPLPWISTALAIATSARPASSDRVSGWASS